MSDKIKVYVPGESRPMMVDGKMSLANVETLRTRLFWKGTVGMIAGGVFGGMFVSSALAPSASGLAMLAAVWGWTAMGWLSFVQRKRVRRQRSAVAVSANVIFVAMTVLLPAAVYVLAASGVMELVMRTVMICVGFGLVTAVMGATAVKLLGDEGDAAMLVYLVRG